MTNLRFPLGIKLKLTICNLELQWVFRDKSIHPNQATASCIYAQTAQHTMFQKSNFGPQIHLGEKDNFSVLI